MTDHDEKHYYFESALKPAVFWVDLEKVGMAKSSGVESIDVLASETLAGEISAKFQKTEPIVWGKR